MGGPSLRILAYLTLTLAIVCSLGAAQAAENAHAEDAPPSSATENSPPAPAPSFSADTLRFKQSLALYAGPGSPVALVDLARLQNVEFVPSAIITLSYGHALWRGKSAAFEAEGMVSKHTERADLYSVTGALSLRWLKTPWRMGSFAIGEGMSYTTGIVDQEAKLDRTSRWLNYLLFEFAFPVSDGLEGFFRVHHRSGIFGLFNGVVGGSDYLCLGVRIPL